VSARKSAVCKSQSLIPVEIIQNKIFLIRGQKVMFDRDLAELYAVTTKRLNEQVKRNIKRFPVDFMFQLTLEEYDNLRSQFATSSWGGRRYMPYVFTDYGVAMLSGVLDTQRAIEVNLQIMRVFTQLRQMAVTHKDLAYKIEALERKFADHDKKFIAVFEAIRQLLKEKEEPPKPKVPIGFVVHKKEERDYKSRQKTP
jgi:hypothetical protein